MLSSLHPLRLMTRTDCEVSNLYQSFFLIEYVPYQHDLKVLYRVTSISKNKRDKNKANTDLIEQGLKIFLLEKAEKSIQTEVGGSFVVTTSDGNRYFAFFRGFDHKIFVSVSKLPIFSFTRTIFQLFENEKQENIPTILHILCEIPIVPAAGLEYEIKLSTGSAKINFSAVEQVEDVDIDVVVQTVMTPLMISKAWEAIILERKVLIVSHFDAVTSLCCEFLRRLVLPLVIVNTYVPLLPMDLLHTVEAPFPYLIGANTQNIKDKMVDLSDTVIIDLDSRNVFPPKNKGANPDLSVASNRLINKLTQEVQNILLQPLDYWSQRPSTQPLGRSQYSNPISSESFLSKSSKILQLFVKVNLSLVGSRSCHIKAFFKRTDNISDYVGNRRSEQFSSNDNNNSTKRSVRSMGYSYDNGVHNGFLQWIACPYNCNEVNQYFMPCWVEMDFCTFSIYESADDLPLVYLLNKDIDSVSPSPLEPEGQVFELVTKETVVYRFVATDGEARRQWIAVIEDMMNKILHDEMKESASTTSTTAPHSASKDQLVASSNNNLENPHVIAPLSSSSFDDINIRESFLNPIGFPFSPHLEDLESDNHKKDDVYFRFYFMKTQMVSSMHSKMECDHFESLMKDIGVSVESITKNYIDFEENIFKYFWREGSIGNMLEQLNSNSLENFPVVNGRSSPDIEAEYDEYKKFATSEMMSKSFDLTLDSSLYSSPAQSIKSSTITPRSISSSQSSVAASPISSEAKTEKQSIFSRLFSRHSSTSGKSESDSLKKVADKQHDDLVQQQHRDELLTIENYKKKITRTVSSYRRCLSELHKAIINDRLSALSELVEKNVAQLNNHTVSFSNSTDSSNPIIFSIPLLLDSIDCSLNPNNEKETFNKEKMDCLSWYNFMWFSLTGKNWDSYKVERCSSLRLTASTFNQDDDDADESNSLSFSTDIYTVDLKHISETMSSYDRDEDKLSEIDENVSSGKPNKHPQPDNSSNDTNQNIQVPISIKKHLLQHLLTTLGESAHNQHEEMKPILSSLCGFLYDSLDELDNALLFYSRGNLVDQKIIMRAVLNHYIELYNYNTNEFNESNFLKWATNISLVVGLHAYRLLIELVYRNQIAKLKSDNFGLDRSLVLGSFRYYPGTHEVNRTTTRRQGTGSQTIHRRGNSHSHGTLAISSFEWVEADGKSELLNESVNCITANPSLLPGELSIELLSRLREILKEYCLSPTGAKSCKKLKSGFLKLKINNSMLHDLSSSSAFRAFEIQCCQLQIEHGILRSSSTKPAIFGPLTLSITYSEKDPRKKLALELPKPFISFCLFSASSSSPQLIILRDANNIDDEIKSYTKQYLVESIKFDQSKKSIELPGILKVYWADFGGNRARVLKMISHVTGSYFYEELKSLTHQTEKPKVEFTTLDWTPYFII